MSPTRQPKGAPEGGRFAAHARAESTGVDLDTDAILPGEAKPGDVLIVDGEPRLVDAVGGDEHVTWIDFASPDLDDDGQPVAFLCRPFPNDHALARQR